MKKLFITIATISTALILTACEDTTSNLDTTQDEHAAYAEFIEHVDHHFEDAESPEVVPVSDYKVAQDISAEHTCYTVVPSSTQGWLLYTVTPEDGETTADRALFLDSDGVSAQLFGMYGTEISGHEADLDEVTTEHIKAGVVFHELQAGTYGVFLSGLTIGTSVKVVIAHGGDEH